MRRMIRSEGMLESEANLTDVSAISTRESGSPSSRLESLLHKCKHTLGTDQQEPDTYYPLTPREGDAMEEWKMINQELLAHGLPSVSLPSQEQESHQLGGSHMVPGNTMEDIAFVMKKLLQETMDQKAELQTQQEITDNIELYLSTQKHEIGMLREGMVTKDEIIEQLNRRCAMLNNTNAKLKEELENPHLGEFRDILTENKNSEQELKNAHQCIQTLESEITLLKATHPDARSRETNPFLQSDVCSRTFDQEDFHLLSGQNLDHASQLFDLTESQVIRKDNSSEILKQIGSFIKLLCDELSVDTIAELYLAIRSMNESKQESESVIIPVFEECVQIMNNPSLPHRFRPQSYERVTLKGFVELIEIWTDELASVSILQEVLKQLTSFAKESCVQQGSDCLALWNLPQAKESEEWNIREMAEFIKLMFLTPGSEKLLSLEVLQGLFSHFSKLFKIHEPINMLTLMNDFQTRLEEMDNVLRVCKVAIGLKENASNSALTNSIESVGISGNTHILPVSAYDQVELLERVKFYENFFFHFEWIISKLFKLLSVKKLSEIIPRIEVLTTDV